MPPFAQLPDLKEFRLHFYPHNISDFNNATRHLTRVQRSVYRDAIELYYDKEKELDSDKHNLEKRLLCINDDEKDALEYILSEFFIKTNTGYFNLRCDTEIVKYRANISAKAKAGIASAEARKAKATHVEHMNNTCDTDEQQTKNYEPITNNHIKPYATRLPIDWIAPIAYIEYCNKKRPDLDANHIAECFKDYWIALHGGAAKKLDWLATWRNWVRNQKIEVSKFKNKSNVVSDANFESWLNTGEQNG